MGKQIAPEDALFSGTPRAAASDLDMELHGGTGTFDMNLDSATRPRAPDMDLTGSAPRMRRSRRASISCSTSRSAVHPIRRRLHRPSRRRRSTRRKGVDDTEEVPIESLGLGRDSRQALDDLEKADDMFPPQAAGAVVEDTIENPRHPQGCRRRTTPSRKTCSVRRR